MPRFVVLVCAFSLLGSRAATAQKKLIEFGWDRPSPAFVAANVAMMERQPFSGVVMQFAVGPRVFRVTGVDTLSLNRDAALLAGTRFQRFTDNFVLMGLTPDSTWDWFDDIAWRRSESNVWRFARAAKAAGLRGIALDYEPYGSNPWDFRKLPHGTGRTFDDYAGQVRARGRRVMRALQAGYPDLTILTFFQMSYLDRIAALAREDDRNRALAETDYGLLASFVAGMLETAAGNSRIVDGNERAYWYADSLAFWKGRQAILGGALTLIPPAVQPAYRTRVQAGQTIFIDYLLGIYQHAGDTLAARVVGPTNRMKRLQFNLYHALISSDEYVWAYSQKINWWKPDSLFPPGLSESVSQAVEAANSGAKLGIEPADLFR